MGVANSRRTAKKDRVTSTPVLLMMLSAVLVLLFFLDLSTGSVSIPLNKVMIILSGGKVSNPTWGEIILNFRLPRIITAILAGGALGVSGLLMQTLFLNPLAGPFVLGINSGASLGVALVILLSGLGGFSSFAGGSGFLAQMGIVFSASLGSLIVISIILFIARRIASRTVILIIGIMFGYAVSALVSVLVHFSLAERVQAFITWSFGSFSTVSWKELQVMIPVLLFTMTLSFPLSKPLNALLLGETYAASMGVDTRAIRILVILCAAVLAATVTAFCGPVAFLGIAIPHLGRNLFRTGDHRILIPSCVLLGGSLAMLADLAAHLPGKGAVLPLNALTSMIGAPVVIWVIARYQHVGGK
ncbi:MAG: iron ABC transporter permease [Synergistales bacterium]|nr:iron ABC transporter permease [Synergistales bacterium]